METILAKLIIDAETPHADLERHVMKAARTSDSNLLNYAADASAEIWRRNHEAERTQTAKQLEIANKQIEITTQQAKSARRAMLAAWASAFVALCLLILTGFPAFSP